MTDSVFKPYQIALAPARKPHRSGLLFTHKNGHFGAISVPERSLAIWYNHSQIQLHELILTQIFVKPVLNGLKAATPLTFYYLKVNYFFCIAHRLSSKECNKHLKPKTTLPRLFAMNRAK